MRNLVVAVVIAACAATNSGPVAMPVPSVLAQIEASIDLDGKVVGATDAPATIVIMFASWCPHCRDELHEIDAIRARHVRVLGVNYRGHEEYDHLGGAQAVRGFASATPWLRVVPIGDNLFTGLGRPPLIPTMFVFDHTGKLIATFDRRQRTPPDRAELGALLARLGA